MKTVTLRTLLLSLLAAVPAAGAEPGFVDVKIRPEYREAILANEHLMHGSVDVVRVADGKEVLVGVGSVAIAAGGSPTPANLLVSRRVAQSKAKDAVNRFLRSEVTTTETVQKETRDEREVRDDGEERRIRRVRRLVDTWIQERATMAAREVLEVGSWYSKDRDILFVAVSISGTE